MGRDPEASRRAGAGAGAVALLRWAASSPAGAAKAGHGGAERGGCEEEPETAHHLRLAVEDDLKTSDQKAVRSESGTGAGLFGAAIEDQGENGGLWRQARKGEGGRRRGRVAQKRHAAEQADRPTPLTTSPFPTSISSLSIFHIPPAPRPSFLFPLSPPFPLSEGFI